MNKKFRLHGNYWNDANEQDSGKITKNPEWVTFLTFHKFVTT